MPFLLVESFREGGRFIKRRPGLLTLIGCGMWIVFAGYNLINASGSIGLVRGEMVATRKHDYSNVVSLQEERARLLEERKIAGAARPSAAILPLIEAEKKQRDWLWTNECRVQANQRQRTYCAGIDKLKAEYATGVALEKASPRLAEIDRLLASSGPVDAVADPQAALLSRLSGLSPELIAQLLPLATPAVLELGSWFMLAFALMLFGGSHAIIAAASVPRPPKPVQAEAPEIAGTPETAALTRQVELARWFFNECTRPVASGALLESDWYAHYCGIVKRSNDKPLPIESFRRIAEQFMPIVPIDGVNYYKEFLPKIPSAA